MMGHYISVTVDVTADEVLEELSDKDLLEELKSRNLEASNQDSHRDALLDVYHHLNVREYSDAMILLHAVLFPKFKTSADCLMKFKAATQGTKP